MLIRTMQRDDFPQVLELAQEFVRQMNRKDQFEFVHAERVLEASAAQSLAYVLDDNRSICGAIMALTSILPWSDATIAQEMMFYLAPEARGEGHGGRMLEKLEQACKHRGIAYIVMVSMVSRPKNMAKTMYERHGFEEIERVWRKRI